MTEDRWEMLSSWHNAWLVADGDDRGRLRAELAAAQPDLTAEADRLIAATPSLDAFLETPAFMLAAYDLAGETPALRPGTLIGAYRIAELIGRGGMGDVYRARDVRLGRDVALKTLSQIEPYSVQRVDRFHEEARITASLDHPNIVRVYDVGLAAGRPYLVEELLTGETLRARLARGPVPAAECCRIGADVARGLTAAHALGLVHRDLKPENIFLTRSGVTKILDFGIAKLAPEPGMRAALSTVTGIVLGTAGYLAPEQIRQDAVDNRTDLFTLGSILFEMLTGRRAFDRHHTIDTLHAIVHDPPADWLQRSDVPPAVVAMVMRLLEKAPDARFQSAGDLVRAFEQARTANGPSPGVHSPPRRDGDAGAPLPVNGAARAEDRRSRPGRVSLAGAAVVFVGAALWLFTRMPGPASAPVRLLTVTAFPGLEGPPSFSPDAKLLAFPWTGPDFLAASDLYVKPIDGDALRRLTDTPGVNEVYPAWSPDGRQIAFSRVEGEENRGVYVIPALGGPERQVIDWGWRPTWLPDSQSLVVAGRTSTGTIAIFHHVLDTGERRQLTTPPEGFFDESPKVSPDGKSVVFVRRTQHQAALFVVATAGGEAAQIDTWVRAIFTPDWTPDSRELLYVRWDANGSRVFRIAAKGGVARAAADLPTESTGLSVSSVGSGGAFRVAVVDARSDIGLRLIDLRAPLSEGRMSAWVPFCDSTRLDWPARFSRDGTRISFTSDRNGPQQIFMATRDGAVVRALTGANGVSAGFASWSPDGQSLVFDAVASDNTDDLYVVNADGGSLRRLTHDDNRETDPEWSRDGRWIYYTSHGSGRADIWKIPASGGTAVQLTTGGGAEPRESPDGTAIYFVEPVFNPYTTTSVKRLRVDERRAQTILSGVWPGAWDVTDTGIVFLTGARNITPGDVAFELKTYRFADGRITGLGEVPFAVTPRGYSPPRVLSVSPDGRWAVVSHMDNWQRDIIVADNFR